MQIPNSGGLYYGQLGLQRSQNNLNQASADVTAATAASQTPPNNTNGGEDIQDGLIDAAQSKLQAQANTKVIATANDMLGTIIDIQV